MISRNQEHDSEASQQHDTLDGVTVLVLRLIYSPCGLADRQQHPAARRPAGPTCRRVQRENKNHNSFNPPALKREPMQIAPFLTFSEGGENKSSSQHKQTVRCGGCSGHFTQIKLVCIKQALCVHGSI